MVLVGVMTILIVMLLYCESAMAESGTYDDIDWDVTDGVLTLGNGGTQVSVNNSTRYGNLYPWSSLRSSITSIKCNGTVKWRGCLNGLCINCPNLMSVDFTGMDLSEVSDLTYCFSYCSSLTDVNLPGLDISSAYTVAGMFQNCTSLVSVNLSGWQVNSLTGMSQMFSGCTNLQTVNLSGWNTPVLTLMGSLFEGCSNLQTVDLSMLNTANVTNMSSMFRNCSALTNVDLSGWDVSNVWTLQSMFDRCSSLASLDLSGWNTGSLTTLSTMFCECTSLTYLNLAGWDTSRVTNMGSLFSGDKVLETLILTGWDTSSVATMSQMFYDCRKLASVEGIENWNTQNVTTMFEMFYNTAFTSLELSGWNVSSVTSMIEMFRGCEKLTYLGTSGWNTANVASMRLMFRGCSKLATLDVSSWNVSNLISTGMESLFSGCQSLVSLDVADWVMPNVTSFSSVFHDCSKLRDIDVSSWDTSNVKNMGSMFQQCTTLPSLDLSGWDVSALTNTNQMFYGCTNLVTVGDLSSWNTSSLQYVSSMFCECSSLLELNMAGWDVSHVTDLSKVFYKCSSLVSVDVSDWDTSNVTTMLGLFGYCSNLTELDLGSFNTAQVLSMRELFAYCSNLVSVNVSSFDTSHVANMYEMFCHCDKLESVDVLHFDTSHAINMWRVFAWCSSLESLDISTWDTSNATNLHQFFYFCSNLKTLDISSFSSMSATDTYNLFAQCSSLQEVILGEGNPFVAATGWTEPLPLPPPEKDGVLYTRKWIRDDRTYGPYARDELLTNYTSAMAGKWVWEKVPTEYTIMFVCTEEGYVGDMPPVTVVATEDYELPGNAFFVFGKDFDHWTDGTRRIYSDREVIPANTYEVNAEVTLTAVFEPRDRSINMQNGSFDFTLKADEKALFVPVPASTSYQVYEQTPFGWNLIKQVGNAGTIMPDEESEILFLNKYDPLKVTIRFAGTKLMNESVAEAETFSFLLYEDDTLVDIATVGDAGVIEFQPITYDQAGVHNYTIQEAIGNDNSVEYDTHVESIVVTVESDGAGHLSVDISMDEDKILFENKSKPGLLALRKAGAGSTDDVRNGTFYYEVQFVTQNGQPYELASSEISYEEREGNIEDFPEVQPIEKPKRTLTVKHIARSGSSESVKQTVVEEHCVGDVVTVNAVNIFSPNGDYYYAPCDASENVVRASDGVYKTVMPDHDCEVMLYYRQYRDITMEILWQNVDCTDELDVSAILYADGEQVAVTDIVHVGESYVFKKYPAYDVNGRAVNYTVDVPLVDGYAIFKGGQYSFRIAPGFHGQIIWDDFDNAYNTRPGSINVEYEQINPIGLTGAGRGTSGYDDWKYYFILQYPENEYPLYRLYVSSLASWYTMITHNDDPDVGIHDIKLKLTQVQVTGSITWDDNNDSAGVRPELVTINVMRDNTFYQRVDLTSGNDWSFRFWKSLYADDGHVYEYTLQPESVDGYRLDVNGSEITASLLRATISKTLWQSNVNRMGVSSLPLRQVISFARSYVYESADELPPSAIRIDDGTTSCSIYFWTEDDKAYCWTDADVLAMATDSSGMFNECSRLTSIDLSGFDSSKVTDMTQMFNGCSGLTFLNVSDLDTSSVTIMPSMFYRCSSLTTLDVSGFDVSNVTSMSSMFQGCSGLTNLAISDWNTGSLEYMSSMFQGCSALTSLDFSNWNTSKLQGLSRTFWDCYGLTSLDLSMFDTHLVTTMYGMFSNCTNLTTIYVGDQWSLDSVTTTFSMFSGCRSLVGGSNTAYSTAYIDGVYACVDNPPDEPGYFTYKAVSDNP